MKKLESQKELIESIEKEPKIDWEFVFLSHREKADAEILARKIKKADIYCPEVSKWTKEREDWLNTVSSGTIPEHDLDRIRNPFVRELVDYLYGSQVIVKLIDIPKEHFLSRKREELYQEWDEIYHLFESGSLDQVILKAKEWIKNWVQWVRDREVYIKQRIREDIPIIVKTHPDLEKKERVKVLISLGAAHTPLVHQLKKEGFDIKRVFAEPIYLYTGISRLARQKTFFPERELKDEEVGLALLVPYLTDYLSQFAKNSTEINRVSQYLLEQIEFEDVKQISRKLRKRVLKSSPPKVVYKYFKKVLPADEEEFNQILRRVKEKYGR